MSATDAPAAGAAAPLAPAGSLSPGYVRYALWVLLIVYILNFLDRQIVNILAEPIKRDLGISDTQIGLLTGLAFALFYTVLGIPIARYADKPASNRVGVIAVALAVWSGMTALCGLAQNFWQLLAARVGVGVGEAGCTPPAHSLISDYVPKDKRSSALAFYGLGIPIGSLLGMAIGGVLADLYGWRLAFLVVGLPGVALALVVWWTLKEPRRALAATLAQAQAQTQGAPQISFREALSEVLASRAFLLIAAGASVVAFLGYGKAVWAAILFIRIHDLSAGQTGLLLGVTAGVAGMLGMWLGGQLADRYGKRDARHYLTGPAIAMAVTAPILMWGYAHTNWMWALALIFLPGVANQMYYGPCFACVQGLVAPRTRAVAAAIMLFLMNLVGLGLGPLLFGMLSDALAPVYGEDSVRMVLIGAGALGIVPAVLFWLAARRLPMELATAR